MHGRERALRQDEFCIKKAVRVSLDSVRHTLCQFEGCRQMQRGCPFSVKYVNHNNTQSVLLCLCCAPRSKQVSHPDTQFVEKGPTHHHQADFSMTSHMKLKYGMMKQ